MDRLSRSQIYEDLHFARTAERVQIEQSPLSGAIKELENDLGVQLFERAPRRTHLAWAGQVVIEVGHEDYCIL
jgi:DNA-binding transcriptional LysR family regulator